MKEQAVILLDKIGLRVTPARKVILTLFLESSKAFSLGDIEILMGKDYDRSTIFRTLEVLSEGQILEKFMDARGVNVYVFHENHGTCSNHNHFHFKCENCQNITALPNLPENYMAFLGKHQVKSLNLMVEGTCENCQSI